MREAGAMRDSRISTPQSAAGVFVFMASGIELNIRSHEGPIGNRQDRAIGERRRVREDTTPIFTELQIGLPWIQSARGADARSLRARPRIRVPRSCRSR